MKSHRPSSGSASATRRCAIYTRVSTDNGLDQEFNSLDAQREACEAYIKSQAHEGWRLTRERFDDGGFSGASLDRPGLFELLDLVDRGRVDIIVVYKVDRLTRSLADFAKLVEKFDAKAASFVSVTQSFNTTSSMGRLTLNMLLSFAQFEREVTGERIRDKIAASKKRGIWLGGGLPLGYRVEDRRLIVDPEEADTVRLVFDLYLECGSLLRLLTELRMRGVTTRRRLLSTGQSIGGIPFTRSPLAYLLKNRIYVGEIRHLDKTYPGEHQAIIEPATFEAVQRLLAQNGRPREPKRHGSAALLKDLLFDDRGFRMTPSSAKKQGLRYRYYVSRALIEGAADDAGSRTRIAAPALEQAVLEALALLVEQSSSDDTAFPTPSESHDPELLLDMVERVIVSRGRFTLVLTSDARDRLHRDRLDVAWSPKPTRPRREVLAPNEPNARAMASEQRSTLVAAIARGRFWLDELTAGTTGVDAIALREKRSARTVQNTVSLAFLSPKIVTAAIDGSLPKGISMSRLFDLPMDWNLQHRALGID
jgi:site-specific DNA recombinase